MKISWTRWWLRGYLLVILLLIFAPVVSIIAISFQSGNVPAFPIHHFSTKWYENVWSNPKLRDGAIASCKVSITVAFVSTVLGLCSAYFVCRQSKSKMFYTMAVGLPALLPSSVSGLALLVYFSKIHLAGSLWAVIVAHIAYISPFAMVLIQRSYERLSIEVEQAAQNLGANSFRIFFEIVLPQIWPGLLAAAIFSFLLSWNEFVLASFVCGFNYTLPVAIYSMMGGALDPSSYAMAVFSMVVSLILIIAIVSFQKYSYNVVKRPK